MASPLVRMKSLCLGLLTASVLFAQVDPKLATTTDLLDVYKSGGGVPEMLTIFDFSGSMQNTFWHEKYWTNLNSDGGNEMTLNAATGLVILNLGGNILATGFLVEPSGAKITTLPITAAVVQKASHARLTAAKSSGGKTYTRTVDIPIPWTLFQVPTALPAAGASPVADSYDDPKSSATVVFDTVYTLAPSNTYTASSSKPITAAIWGNTSGGTATYTSTAGASLATGDSVTVTGMTPAVYDGTFLVTARTSTTFKVLIPLGATPGPGTMFGTASYGGNIGLFTYNPDYAYWLFWGNVNKAADGNSYDTAAAAGVDDDRNQAPPGGSVFTTSTTGLGGTYPAGGGYVIPGVYDPASGSAGTASTTQWSDKRGTTFNNGIPAGTRCMFLKKAVLQTWLSKQDKVLWAYRFLDNANEIGVNPNSTNFGAGERKLTQFKSVAFGIHASVSAIQVKKPSGGTPLTSALSNAYAQLIETAANASVFDKFNTGIDPSPCRSSFVILFTDGLANQDHNGSAEVSATATTTVVPESALKAIPFANLDIGATNYNIWSLAAVAAHGNDNGTNNASQRTTGSGTPSQWAPFHVMNRGANGSSGRKITTMTVGLSLAGSNTSNMATGGKGPLLRTALYGDPAATQFDLQYSVAFGKTPINPTGRAGVSANFFDASDPNALIASLSAIIARVTSANTSITAPAAPLVGLNLGNRAYLGRFATLNAGDGSGSVWQGDLLVAGLGIQTDGTVGLKDFNGDFQLDINAGNAVASASNALKSLGWKNRRIYTMIPGTAIPATGLELTQAKQSFSDTNAALFNPKVMGVATSTQAKSLIRFIRGASKDAQADGTTITSRNDIMGDVVNSSPTAVEYDPALIPGYSGLLTSAWASYSGYKDARFQVIFVGDNQGHFHAFGEVSALNNGVLVGTLDELWSFVPPELLNNPSVTTTIPKLSVLQDAGNDHIYTVDGSPYIYFKDTPHPGSATGNRRVDTTDTARVIFGMRKGGRSFYALDILDPANPKLAWMVDPNTSTDPTIQTMGLSTSTPSVARVETGGSPAVVKDVVFVGGGYSNNELDALIIGNNAVAKKLGRSLIALDVTDGTPIKYYDFVNNGALAAGFPNMGAISAGAFPLEFYVGSRKAQRVYFGDHSGGVYALGSMQTLNTPPVGWRLDNSNIDQWTTDGSANVSLTPGNAGIRWIYKGQTGLTLGKVTSAAPISSVPVAYRIPKVIPQFQRPSGSSNAPNMTPPVVGVTFGTGDRNDPMDLDPVGPVASAPFRQIMVFDRQDSADLPTVSGLPSNVNDFASAITDAQLSNQTGTVTPGDTSYLGNNQYLGYYLSFHNPTTDPGPPVKLLFEKSYLNPLVVNGGLIFSTFKPGKTGSTVVCEGAGVTYTYRMCDALAPVFSSGDLATSGTTDKQLAGCNGYVFSWTNLAGDLTAIGSRMVLQSGQDTPAAGVPTTSNVKIQDLVVQGGTQSFAPRAWRIIR